MTEFVIKPYKRVEIHSLIKISFEEFQKRRTLEELAPKWCDGVLFAVFPISETVDTVQDELAGIQHWQYVEVTEQKQKISMLKMDGRELPVFDVSSNQLFADFVTWLKTTDIWEAKN